MRKNTVKDITRETIPYWYELSYQNDGIVLRIHEDAVKSLPKLTEETPIVELFKDRLNLPSFSGKFGEDFGFGRCLKYLGTKECSEEYFVEIPFIPKEGDRPCPLCDGSGSNLFFGDEKCIYCEGSGGETIYDYQVLYAISATLNILLSLLEFLEIETKSFLPQTMFVCVCANSDREMCNGWEVSGTYSLEAVAWMKKHGAGEIPEMVSAMRAVWTKMHGSMKKFYEYSFRASLADNSGWLCTYLPGNACGLHPEHGAEYKARKGHGFKFYSHNVDYPTQQLVILASLAALSDLMRKG